MCSILTLDLQAEGSGCVEKGEGSQLALGGRVGGDGERKARMRRWRVVLVRVNHLILRGQCEVLLPRMAADLRQKGMDASRRALPESAPGARGHAHVKSLRQLHHRPALRCRSRT